MGRGGEERRGLNGHGLDIDRLHGESAVIASGCRLAAWKAPIITPCHSQTIVVLAAVLAELALQIAHSAFGFANQTALTQGRVGHLASRAADAMLSPTRLWLGVPTCLFVRRKLIRNLTWHH